jgi:hypothetical protein
MSASSLLLRPILSRKEDRLSGLIAIGTDGFAT